MDKTPEKGERKETTAKIIPKKDMSWKRFFVYLFFIVLFRMYVIEPHSVTGSSMDETFHTGDYVLVDKISYAVIAPHRGDVIVFNPPVADRTEDRFIKRIIGVPGDVIDVTATDTFVNGEKQDQTYITHLSSRTATATLKEDEYFVMGDNRAVSYDSRSWGILKKEHIQGRVVMRLFPFNQIDILPGNIKNITQ